MGKMSNFTADQVSPMIYDVIQKFSLLTVKFAQNMKGKEYDCGSGCTISNSLRVEGFAGLIPHCLILPLSNISEWKGQHSK